MSATLCLGLDLGSLNLRGALLASGTTPRWLGERRAQGRVLAALDELLGELEAKLDNAELRLRVTGVGRSLVSSLPAHQGEATNEIVALGEAVARLCPEARSALEIGAHTSRWIGLDEDGSVNDYALNEQCAAGSGAFIEQQAARLRLDVAGLSAAAARASRAAPVAGRCSVFAKSDMIHLQQKGIPLEEIAFGLCRAVARNALSSLLRGRGARLPLALVGGAAANAGLRRAFAEALGSEPIVPELAPYFPALGAALLGGEGPSWTVASLRRELRELESAREPLRTLPRLVAPTGGGPALRPEPRLEAGAPCDGFLGVDVGSVSTNLVLIDRDANVLDAIYFPTRGQPLEVLREAVAELRSRAGARLEVLGVGTTGSGRHLAAALLGADVVQNEITCQLVSAQHYFPEVDTIIEIGGQDSKFIRAEGGRILDFTMNKICAAGTGSFLEEEAARLGVSIIGEFAERALEAGAPADLGCRCTVFMDTEVVVAQARKATLPDLCAGLAFAIARNYLDRVVEGRKLGERIVIQGGVAANRAVVAAFTGLLGRTVEVHPLCRVSGAIGAALQARAHAEEQSAAGTPRSAFRGLGVFARDPRVRSFECEHCENHCQVSRVELRAEQDGQRPLRAHFGDACERFSARDGAGRLGSDEPIPDLLAEREALVRRALQAPRRQPRGVIGLPWASFMHADLVFWATLLGELGFEVRCSTPSSTRTLERSAANLPAETCLPIKLAFGHVAELCEAAEVDAVLVPSLARSTNWQGEGASSCPYVQSLPFMLGASLRGRLLTPELRLEGRQLPGELGPALAAALAPFGVSERELAPAIRVAAAAQRGLRVQLRSRGDALLARRAEEVRVALLGKPYNLCDPFLNLNLGRHLRRLGVLAIPLDFLPLGGAPEVGADLGLVPWRYSRDLLRGVAAVQARADLHPILVSNYGCGPDAFTGKHAARLLRGRPHLELEFDEHRGEAGLITRLEAFLDEIRAGATTPTPHPRRLPPRSPNQAERFRGRRVFVPYFADHAYAVVGALRSAGLDARLLPLPDRETASRAERCSSGRECHAYGMLAADLDRLADDHEPGDVFFLPGSNRIPCLIQQYTEAMQILLEERGLGGREDLEILSPDMEGYRDLLGYSRALGFYQGLLAIDLLVRASCALRPYEVARGSVDRIHEGNLAAIEGGLATGELERALEGCATRLAAAELRAGPPRPRVGVAGDIYTRSNQAANNRLFWKLEALGCEVWPAPFLVDLAVYGIEERLRESLLARDPKRVLRNALVKLWQTWINHKVAGRLRRAGPRLLGRSARGTRWDEPDLDTCLALAEPYIGRCNMDLLQWNVAKMIDFARRGASGIVNAVAQNCMVGTISTAITRRIREDHDGIPLVTLVYGASETDTVDTSLEAFAHQVHRFAARSPGHRGLTHRASGAMIAED